MSTIVLDSKCVETCSKMCCTPFFSYQDISLAPSSPSLANPIHALFANDRFTSSAGQSERLNYTAAFPALQVASRFLTLDSVVKLIVIKVDGDLLLKDSAGVIRGTTWAEVDAWHKEHPDSVYTVSRHARPEHEVVGEEMRLRAQEILEQVVPMVEFDFSIIQSGVGGHCLPVEGPLSEDLGSIFPRGCRSLVQINARHWSQFLSTADQKKSANPVSSLTLVKLAVLFIHELFHALEGAYNNSPYTETYYGDSPMSECGCEAENAIFGGILQNLSCAASLSFYNFCSEAIRREAGRVQVPAIMLRPWPTYPRLRRYGYLEARVGVRWNYRGPEIEVVDRMDGSFAQQLLSEEFWAEGVGCGPLALPKVDKWAMEWCELRQAAIFVKKLKIGQVEQRIWRLW